MPEHDVSNSSELTKVDGGWMTHDRVVPILQEDIDHGKQRDQWGCAIVRAIQRKFPDSMRVRANAKLIGFTIGEARYTYPTPKSAVEQIIKPFDRGEEIQPTVLRLTGGKVKDAIHSDIKAREVMRNNKRDRKNREVSERQQQMSPTYAEYERFQ